MRSNEKEVREKGERRDNLWSERKEKGSDEPGEARETDGREVRKQKKSGPTSEMSEGNGRTKSESERKREPHKQTQVISPK